MCFLFPLAFLAATAPGPERRPLVTHEPDGSYIIHRAIHAEEVSLQEATDGLLADERDEDRQRQERDAEEDVEQAFEEAVDAAEPRAPD